MHAPPPPSSSRDVPLLRDEDSLGLLTFFSLSLCSAPLPPFRCLFPLRMSSDAHVFAPRAVAHLRICGEASDLAIGPSGVEWATWQLRMAGSRITTWSRGRGTAGSALIAESAQKNLAVQSQPAVRPRIEGASAIAPPSSDTALCRSGGPSPQRSLVDVEMTARSSAIDSTGPSGGSAAARQRCMRSWSNKVDLVQPANRGPSATPGGDIAAAVQQQRGGGWGECVVVGRLSTADAGKLGDAPKSDFLLLVSFSHVCLLSSVCRHFFFRSRLLHTAATTLVALIHLHSCAPRSGGNDPFAPPRFVPASAAQPQPQPPSTAAAFPSPPIAPRAMVEKCVLCRSRWPKDKLYSACRCYKKSGACVVARIACGASLLTGRIIHTTRLSETSDHSCADDSWSVLLLFRRWCLFRFQSVASRVSGGHLRE